MGIFTEADEANEDTIAPIPVCVNTTTFDDTELKPVANAFTCSQSTVRE